MSLPTLPAPIAMALICALAEDDAFRALFASNPASALVSLGLPAADAELVKICCQVNQLASKEAIHDAKQELQTMLTRELAQLVPALDASPGPGWSLKGP